MAYIKPSVGKHDSGFGVFEVGYCEVSIDNKVINKQVLGNCSDAIHLDQLFYSHISYNTLMDLTLDGYIRIFSHQGNLRWEGTFDTSDMWLTLVPFKADDTIKPLT